MCSPYCINFGKSHLTETDIKGRSVIEVGALNINGSLRSTVEALGPASYVGIDVKSGPGVDLICNAENLIEKLGRDAYDVVICTELLEHVLNWDKVIHNLKGIVKPAGAILITTRAQGFKYHGYPFDFWRYELSDMKYIFSDFNIRALERDPECPGVFFLGQKPMLFIENELAGYKLYSILTGRKSSMPIVVISSLLYRFKKNLTSTVGRIMYYIEHASEIPEMLKRKWNKISTKWYNDKQ